MEQQYKKQNKTPTGIKVVSVFNYIFAVLGILFAIAGIIGGIYLIFDGNSMASQVFGSNSQTGTLGAEISSKAGTFYTSFGFIVLGLGIVSGLFSAFLIVVGSKMWKGKNWARVSEILLTVLWTMLWSVELFKGYFLNLVPIFPALIILLYLMLSNNVKNFFS